MSGEISPPGKGSGPGSSAELRASHADRHRVVDVLRIAAGDGLLTADELDERLEAALSARTVSELAALTADLPLQRRRRGRRRARLGQEYSGITGSSKVRPRCRVGSSLGGRRTTLPEPELCAPFGGIAVTDSSVGR